MKRHPKPPARALAGALAFLMAFALAAPPALAAEAEAEAQGPVLNSPTTEKPTLVAMAEARVQSSDPAEAVAAAQSNDMAGEKSFFKSPQGIAAIALLVGGTILVAYSRSNDRPKSVVR